MAEYRILNEKSKKQKRLSVIFFIEPDGNVTISSLSEPMLSIAQALNPEDQIVRMLSLHKSEVANVTLYNSQDKTYCG
jgi:hypothetical protein